MYGKVAGSELQSRTVLADLTLGSSDIPQICTGKNVGFLIVRTVY
jgi:hypothetical protein